MKVFISHSSRDKPAVEQLALELGRRGFDPWLDKWEIQAGDDIVASINRGLDEAQAILVVFSEHTDQSRWVGAELSFATWSRIEQNLPLIPVMVSDQARVPPLLRPLLWRRIDEVQAIDDALRQRSGKPKFATPPELGRLQRVLIRLRPDGAGRVQAEVQHGNQLLGSASQPYPPADLPRGLQMFRSGFGSLVLRDAAQAGQAAQKTGLIGLGRTLGALCLPGSSGAALARLLDAVPVGSTLEVGVEAEGAELLSLPFEALRLPDDRVLALQPPVVMWRRPAGLQRPPHAALAGPLKVLVAVGAPDEDRSRAAVLDHERELGHLLDAVEPMARQENAEVRILEVGHPDAIGAAFRSDAYHVLHLSCHGGPGELELEDEDGGPVRVTPQQLLAPLQAAGRPLPLVLLNACHGGVQGSESASFAEALLRAGIPAVLAMQTSVSDDHATRLARAFYTDVTTGEHLRPSRALAQARRLLEQERQQALRQGDRSHSTAPEYATATLYLAGDEAPLANFGLDKVPLSQHTGTTLPSIGNVPLLGMDDLIGRRRELRATMRVLRSRDGESAGVVLTGIGGVGKSSVAGRAMQRLHDEHWALAVSSGALDLGPLAAAVAEALGRLPDAAARQLGQTLAQPDLPDEQRLPALGTALARHRVLLVLDDFEQNLTPGGDAFRSADAEQLLGFLIQQTRHGRLLITCRHPVPGTDGLLEPIAIGPLSAAEVRKLVLRLPGLHGLDGADQRHALTLIGGHPRMLELLDALLRKGKGRLKHVTVKLQQLAKATHVTGQIKRPAGLDAHLQTTLLLGARDIFLDELLALAREANVLDALLQLAVSNLPVSPDGLARMLATDPADPVDTDAAAEAIDTLGALSLAHRDPDGLAWVHRWTAEGLTRTDPAHHADRCARAGRYRWWRVGAETHSIDDATEALRNFLAAGDFDSAGLVAKQCLTALTNFQQLLSVAALASEVLEQFPPEHGDFNSIADHEAQAHLALGWLNRALARYQTLLERHQRLAQAEPQRADLQRDLIVSHVKIGLSADGTEEANRHLLAAWQTFSALKAEGRLNPSDEHIGPALQQTLAERGVSVP